MKHWFIREAVSVVYTSTSHVKGESLLKGEIEDLGCRTAAATLTMISSLPTVGYGAGPMLRGLALASGRNAEVFEGAILLVYCLESVAKLDRGPKAGCENGRKSCG